MAYAAWASMACTLAARPFTSPASRTQNRGTTLTRHSSLVPQRLFLIGSNAIRNLRIPLKQHAIFFPNRSRIACSRAPFSRVLRATNHVLRRTTHASLIASRQLLEIELTSSQQTRKLFLIASFSARSAHASRLAALTAPHPSPTMKSMPCTLPQDELHLTAVADHGSLITNHHSLLTGLNHV